LGGPLRNRRGRGLSSRCRRTRLGGCRRARRLAGRAGGGRIGRNCRAGLACRGRCSARGGRCSARGGRGDRLDHLFADFRLAVTARIQLRERGKAFLYPFIVGAVLGACRVDFVQLDRLLLEGKRLLLQQYVVLFQFVLGQILRPLRTHQVLAELAIQFGALEGGRRGHSGHLVIDRLLVGLECRFHGLAFLGERFLEGNDQLDALEFLARRYRQRQRRLGRQGPAAIGAGGARGAIRRNDVLEPVVVRR